MAVDPVCKTDVDEMDADSTDYADETYFFCSNLCKRVFEEDPELFTRSEFNDRHFRYSRDGVVMLSR
jgi:YHS domain-containing protein